MSKRRRNAMKRTFQAACLGLLVMIFLCLVGGCIVSIGFFIPQEYQFLPGFWGYVATIIIFPSFYISSLPWSIWLFHTDVNQDAMLWGMACGMLINITLLGGAIGMLAGLLEPLPFELPSPSEPQLKKTPTNPYV